MPLSFFTGIRLSEIQRLDWSAIDLHEKFLKLPAAITKTKQGRHIDISDSLAAWLNSHVKESGKVVPCSPESLRNLLEALKEHHGVATIKHGPRHCFASYWLAEHGDINQLCRYLGHDDPETTFRHYAKAATKRDALKFSSILPSKKKPSRRKGDKTLDFKKEASIKYRKYQARKLYDSASSEIKNKPLVGKIRFFHAITSKNENLKAALFGDLKDRPGAMLAIEIRTLAKLGRYLATLPDDEREQEEIEHNVIQRTGAAKFRLSIAAERSGGRFFKDFADGIAFFKIQIGAGKLCGILSQPIAFSTRVWRAWSTPPEWEISLICIRCWRKSLMMSQTFGK